MTTLKTLEAASGTATVQTRTHERSQTKKLHLNLTCLARELDTSAARLLKPFNLTPTRFDILEELMIHKDGLTQAEIARSLRVQPANVLAALRPLEKNEWIEKASTKQNKKEKIITIKADRETQFLEIIDVYYQAMNQVFCDDSPQELEEWMRRIRIRLNS